METIETSETIKEIAIAICNFQKEVGKIKKESTNPFFKSKYASLSNILDVIQEPLNNNNLSIIQMPIGQNQLTTMVLHNSGEWIKGTYLMTPTKTDPQSLGSAITYQRRYALGAVLNLNIDDDDDGNIASKSQTTTPIRPEYTIEMAIKEMNECITIDMVKLTWEKYKQFKTDSKFLEVKEQMKIKLIK